MHLVDGDNRPADFDLRRHVGDWGSACADGTGCAFDAGVSLIQQIRAWLSSGFGKPVAGLLAVGLFCLAGYIVYSSLQSEMPDDAHYTMYICTETGKPFRHRNQMGETQPILSPHSGKNTGVPAEACYWNADGSSKDEPTWVLLNPLAGRPGPTFCPDCGRLVVGHNPPPQLAGGPPPTEREYTARQPAPRKDATAAARDDRP